jgi:hypothetical protein
MTTIVREFIPAEDLDGVAALCRWAWWPERDLAGWTWLTQAPGMAGRPLGWVCADDSGEIVGFMGNFVQERHQGPAPDSDVAPVICGHTFLVHPKAMGKARMLMRRILDQGEVAATYTFNANSRSAGFFKHFGFETWPGAGADTKLVWPVAPLTLGAERLLRRWAQARKYAGVQGGREWFSPPPAPILATTRKTPSVRVLDPRTDIDARFDDLWRELLATGASLARRDAAALGWRVADPMLTTPPILLAYEVDGGLAGYLLAVLAKGTEIEAPALEIIDLIALPKVEAVALPALVTALIGLARPLGAARVRLGLAHPRVEALLAPTRPARRKTPYSHCHVRFGRPDKAVDRDGWYATPFDGDQSFTSRPTPG